MAEFTFILGAGLGKEYGFPDGAELRNLIVSELDEHETELREIFQVSYALTVDEIATRYSRHATTIRKIVAKILRDRENAEKLLSNGSNTYKLLLRQISGAEARGNKVNIITYNYDRSLPYLLHRTNLIEDEQNKIRAHITHVHGRLAPLGHEDPNIRNRQMPFHDYGTEQKFYRQQARSFLEDEIEQSTYERDNLNALFQASNFDFIGDTIVPKKELGDMLRASATIVFLGVRYHDVNMKALDFDFTDRQGKLIVGTGFGLSKEEIELLKQLYPTIQEIIPCTAHQFLSAQLDISRPDRSLLKRKATMLDPDVAEGFERLTQSLTRTPTFPPQF